MHTVDTMKGIMTLRVHIAPVGFEIDRIIIPAVEMKADKVWLVVHDNVAEDKASKYRDKIEKSLEEKGIKTEINEALSDGFEVLRDFETGGGIVMTLGKWEKEGKTVKKKWSN